MTIFNSTDKIHHATKAKAEKLAVMLEGEYPVLSLHPVRDEESDKIIGFQTYFTLPDEDPILVTETPKVPELADIIEACEDKDLDPEALTPAPKATGSIVDEAYRSRYREISTTGRCNGDELAEWLAGETIVMDKTNFDDLEAIFQANSLDLTAKWARAKEQGSRGWQGRYRMNGRQVLEKIVAKQGFVYNAQGSEHYFSDEFITALRDKHAKWLAKEAKREAAENEVAEAAAGKQD